jgi:hypothetical protein
VDVDAAANRVDDTGEIDAAYLLKRKAAAGTVVWKNEFF